MTFLETALEHAAMMEQWTLCTVEDVPDEAFAEQPHGMTNHPAWVLGHLTYALEHLTSLLGGTAAHDETWYAPYLGGSAPTSNRADYPSKTELIDAFTAASAEFRRTVRARGEDVLDTPVDNEQIAAFFPTLGRWMTHVLGPEVAFHCGQLSAWRRVKGLPSVFEVESNLGRMVASALTV